MTALVTRFKTARAVFEASESEIRDSKLLDERTLPHLSDSEYVELGLESVRRLRELGCSLVTIAHPLYPENLKDIDGAPPLLYVIGELKEEDSLSIGIVGSRRATAYGRATADRLSFELASRKVTVVSGFATGIDTAAHRGALRAGGRTIAVLGCGLDVDYPAGNRNLRDKIPSSGALVTEFPLGTQPLPGNFPRRNRIISGISLGILVVEASVDSGTFTTVRWAADQGREVFAVPGDINRRTSFGTNRLIRDGAKLTACAEDVLEEIGITEKGVAAIPEYSLSDEEKSMMNGLESGPAHIDEIASNLKMPVNKALTILLSLELKGAVKQSPGKIFSLQ
jgi:DNA processing protein